MYKDKTIVCKDCGQSFTFTAREQEFFAEKGYTNEPQRCKPCRDAKKGLRNNGDRNGNRQMFPAVCANCGADCQVSFQPRDGRPVYCSDCFRKMK
ncbi:MAG: zinc-binding protein [Erysipelotrichaceae bacterium]|jgi:CxxC-x17-CxxC domain-containing protein|nr:zinc-binding protein [Erysipelotrichaceae bacterium]